MSQVKNTAPLIGLLQLAYSGELAAAYAYRGHSKSVSDPEERRRIEEIEREEWHHRKLVGEMLTDLRQNPTPLENTALQLLAGSSGSAAISQVAGANVWSGTLGEPQHSRV